MAETIGSAAGRVAHRPSGAATTTIGGDSGDDTLWGNYGDDVISGGPGEDFIDGDNPFPPPPGGPPFPREQQRRCTGSPGLDAINNCEVTTP